MRRILNQRSLAAASYAALLGTVLVCGLGVHQTLLQYQNVRGTLLEAHTRLARAQSVLLARSLETGAARALDQIASRADDIPALGTVSRREPLVEEPFVITAAGSLASPLAEARTPANRYLAEGAPPAAFDAAVRRAHAAESGDEGVTAFLELCARDDVSALWRLRAACTAAALQLRGGKPDAAAALYRRLLAEFREELRRGPAPSLLQVRLALHEALRGAGRLADAATVFAESFAELRAETISVSITEEEFFLRRAAAFFHGGGGEALATAAVQDDIDRLTARLERQRTSLAVLELLRDWIRRGDGMSVNSSAEPPPRHFYQEVRGAPVLALWQPLLSGSSLPPGAVVGFRVSPSGLEQRLAGAVRAQDPDSRLAARLGRQTEGFVHLATLEDPYWFVGVGYDDDTWRQLEGEARAPFIIAATLIGGLGVVLVVSLLVLLRSVRREMLLARYKTEFVANVSHELKTPLALIRLFGETLLLGRVSDEKRRSRYYEIITRESERLTQLIANVLDFSSIEAGRKDYKLRSARIDDIVRATLDSYRFELEAKGFAHRLLSEGPLPPTLADADAVAQAVINLLQNAVKYSPETKDITIRVTHRANEIRVAVSDRGSGIPREEQSLVWKDYYRGRSARASGTRGSGLGLSLVRHILEAHGGRVELESEPGRGSTFTIVFPVVLVSKRPENASATERPEREPGQGDGSGVRA